MRLNLAPFIDLFSILAIGLLIVMTVTSGTDKPTRAQPNYTIVFFYLGRPDSIEKKHPGIASAGLVEIDPYFLVQGVETPPSHLAATVDIRRDPDSIQVMVSGQQDGLSVAFRVRRIMKPEVLFEKFQTSIVKISGGHSVEKRMQTMGQWIDPVVVLSG